MNFYKKTVSAICALMLMVSWAFAENGEQPEISAKCAILADGDTLAVLYEKSCTDRMLIASTTKIMTALVVLENCDVSETVEIKREYTGIEGSSIYLREGEQLTVEELLYGLLLKSGNDAAVALACHTAGSVKAFAEMMNDKANDLKLKNSHFENPHGLDSAEHYSCAEDLAKITAQALKNETFRTIVATKSVTMAGRYMENHNKLLGMYDGAFGVKTGYTRAAGRILVSAAEKDGRTLICVTISDPDDWNDHINLLNYGFSKYTPHLLCKAGECVAHLSVIGGDRDSVAVVTAEECRCALLESECAEKKVYLPRFVYADVSAGSRAGYALYTLPDGREVKVELVYAADVSRRSEKSTDAGFWQMVQRMA